MQSLMAIGLIFVTTIVSVIVVFVGVMLTLNLKRRILLSVTILVILSYVALLILQPDNFLLSDILVLITSVMAGSLLGTTIINEASVITFSVTVAIVDFFSFSGGPTAKIISSYQGGKSLLLQYLAISIPLGSKIVPIVGIGDLLIMGAIFYSLKRLNYSSKECLLVPNIGLLMALVIGLIVEGIYALPFVAAMVITYLIYRKRSKAVHQRRKPLRNVDYRTKTSSICFKSMSTGLHVSRSKYVLRGYPVFPSVEGLNPCSFTRKTF